MFLFAPPAFQAQVLSPPPTQTPTPGAALSLDLPGALSRAGNENPMLRAAKARGTSVVVDPPLMPTDPTSEEINLAAHSAIARLAS